MQKCNFFLLGGQKILKTGGVKMNASENSKIYFTLSCAQCIVFVSLSHSAILFWRNPLGSFYEKYSPKMEILASPPSLTHFLFGNKSRQVPFRNWASE